MSNLSCRRLVAPLAAAAVFTGCGGESPGDGTAVGPTTTRTSSNPAELFRYDASEPPATKTLSSREIAGGRVTDLVFEGGRREVPAYVIEPVIAGRSRPAVVFAHWFSSAPNGNRDEFLTEALALSDKGIVSILPGGWFPWLVGPTKLEDDRANIAQQVIELRRAIDLLVARDDVDAGRIGFVGHDYGAMYGALLAAFDGRPKAYVLMAPDATFSTWFLRYWSPEGDTAVYRRGLARLDPARALARVPPRSVFLQFGSYDGFVPAEVRRRLAAAVRKPQRVVVYETSHDLDDAARRDRDAWLLERLSR